MAKTNQTATLVTVVEGLTTATEALNNTAKAIFELVTGESEAVATPKTIPASKKAVKEVEPEDVDSDGEDDLEEMTIQDLRKKAKELGLKAGGSKVSLIEAIREELGDADEEEEEEDETEEEEEESEDDEDDSEDEEEIDLDELDVDELVSFIEENELGDVPAKKKKEKEEAYADRLRAFIEEALAEEEDEEDDTEEESDDDEEEEEVDLEELSDDELIALAEENEVDVPYSGKGKKKKLDREALIEALSELEEDEDEEDEDDSDDEDEDEDDEDEEELTPEDLEDMSDDELKELCEDFEISLGKKFNRKKAIEALVEYMESEDEE